MKNGTHKNGAQHGAQVSPAAAPPHVAGEAFFTLSRAEVEALYPDLAVTPFRSATARGVVRRMTEALR